MQVQIVYRDGNQFMGAASDALQRAFGSENVRVLHNPSDADPDIIACSDITFSKELRDGTKFVQVYDFLRQIHESTYLDIAKQLQDQNLAPYYLGPSIDAHTLSSPLLSEMLDNAGWQIIKGKYYLERGFGQEGRRDHHGISTVNNLTSSQLLLSDFTPDNAVIGIDHHVVTDASDKEEAARRFANRKVVLLCPCCVHFDASGAKGTGYGEDEFRNILSSYDRVIPNLGLEQLSPNFDALVAHIRTLGSSE